MFVWKDLDARTRVLMEQEVEADLAGGRFYASKRLTPSGEAKYVGYLLAAIRCGSEQTLMESFRRSGRFWPREAVGASATQSYEATPSMFAEWEFNRYYVRALCIRAIQDESEQVIVYRAKDMPKSSIEVDALIGRAFCPRRLLNDLRNLREFEFALGLRLSGSGLSVQLPLR